jgi:hypothetical protein
MYTNLLIGFLFDRKGATNTIGKISHSPYVLKKQNMYNLVVGKITK